LSNLPVSLFFLCEATLLYTPLLVMYLSGNVGRFSVASLAWPAALCVTSLVIPCLLRWRWRKLVDSLDTLLVGPALYVLIVSTFFPVHGNVLDGRENAVRTADRLSHDGLMVVCLLAALVSLSQVSFRRAVMRARDLLGLFALAASIYMAVSILPLHRTNQDAHYAAALSPRRNIVVLMLDMMQGGFGSEYFRRHPSAEQSFDGFVFYKNAASFAPFTALSYSGFMSGGYPGKDQVHDNSVRDTIYYKENIIDDLADRGYATRYYSIIPYRFDNERVTHIPDDIGLPRHDNFLIWALTMRGRYLPYAYLPFGIKYMPWTQREFGMFSKTDARDSLKWFLHDTHVDPRIDKGFVWFHSLATHQPIRLDAEGRFSLSLTADDANGEVAYVFGELRAFVERLKVLQVYDDSLLIVLSDHGYNILDKMKETPPGEEYALSSFGNGITVGQYEPLFMVKRPGAHGALSYDDSAVTLLDLRKSLAEFTSPGAGEGMDGFNFLGDEKGSPNRTVPVIKFVGSTFDNARDFTSLDNWRRDVLRLPLGQNYPRLAGPSTVSAQAGSVERK
jgi:hypothetical protein